MVSDIMAKLFKPAEAKHLLLGICNKLEDDFGLTACFGTEIEFYLLNDDISDPPFVIKKEKGRNQYEIDLPPLNNASLMGDSILSAKKELQQWRPGINFHPKPFLDDYGSAMHFHVNLLKEGMNYYDDKTKLEAGARALCHYLRRTFLVFAPHKSDYTRFDGKMMAPTRVAYGGNNRSVAIRIPDARPYRLEHRVASPETDAYLALFTILKSLYLGMKYPENVGNYTKIHGNAFDEQYHLEVLPRNLEEAIAAFDAKFYTLS